MKIRFSPTRVLALAGTAFVAASVSHADVLHSNGTIITDPTGGTGVIAGLPISKADIYNIPTSTSNFSTTGVAATVATNTAAADDFTVPASGWDLDAVTLYAFQTSQLSPSITKIHINLWTAKPYLSDSPDLPTPAPSPLQTPVLAASLVLDAGPGTFVCHRQSHSSTSTNRPVFSYTVSLNDLPNGGQLPPGTYWLQWSFEGASSPSSNVFMPMVSPRTSVTGHNARLLNSVTGSSTGPRTWFEGREGFVANVAEGRAYELPFELLGTALPTGPTCNDLDFNNDGNIEPGDVDAYFSVLGEGPCLGDIGGGCDSLDFNNDGNIEPEDVDAYFSVLGEGPCVDN